MKNDTLKKLKATWLPTFAETSQNQINQKAEYDTMPCHERFMLLFNAELNSRHNNNIKRSIKKCQGECTIHSVYCLYHAD